MLIVLLLSIAPIAGREARAEQIALARDGQPLATIVVPAEAGDRLEAAADDLQGYVRAICGVELPIRRDGRQVDGTGLYIGECEPTTDADMPPPGLNPETYAIRVRDGSIFFTGRWPTPTCFAVVSFIEDNLGVRWFAPGELWQYVPEGEPGDLVVEVEERVRTPDTSPRIWSGHAWTEDWDRWNLRNKTVLSEVVPRRQFQNFLQRVFPPAEYGETHPEYYPLIDGKRWIPGEGQRYWRPCESNPDVIRLTVEYARKWFDGNPNTDSFSVGMDDISHLCGCENCRALDPQQGSYEKREFSDRHYKFVNTIAREIAKTHPDRYIGTLIYSIARTPPETVEKLEDNVFGFITETSALWWQEGRKEADHELTREWARRCKHLSRYDYYGMGCLTPRVYPHAMDEQIKFDKSLGLEGMYTEVYTFLPNTAPMIWAFAKLQWEGALDIDELLGDFYAKMFGDAAGTMKEYFDLLERSWNTPRLGRQGWVHRRIQNQALAMSAEDVDEGFRLLDRAMAATDDPKAQARIDIIRGGLQYGSYVIRAYDLSQQLTAAPVTDRGSAQACLAMSQRLVNLSAEREQFWAEAAERDDLLGANVRGLMERGYWITGQAPNVERGGFVAAMRVLGWYAKNAPDELADVADRLSGTGGPIADMVEAWRWAQEADPPNLLTNGDFEDPAPNQEQPEMDWSTRGAPTGWSVWSRTQNARFAVLGGQGQDGSAAAAISGAESACYLQGYEAQPGDRFLCICWVRGGSADQATGARLSIRFRQPNGSWHPKRDVEPTINAVEGQDDWQPLALITTVPEGAGSLVVMLGAGGQDEGAQALFDNVALYRLP